MNAITSFAESPLNFDVVKTPLAASMPDGSISKVRGKVGLTRTDNGDTIAIVGERYGLVQNADLFNRIDDEVFSAIGDDHRDSAVVKDRIARGGALCIRDYSFPKIKLNGAMDVELSRSKDDNTDIGFRLIVSNGFGGSSLAVMAGAIDYFCTNGMVLGKLHGAYQVRHTRKVEVRMVGVDKAARDAISIFHDHADVFADYVSTAITDEHARRIIVESKCFSDALSKKIYGRYLVEKQDRGANVWALYSAGTHYASHLTGPFATRNTGNDHTAATMMARTKKVSALVLSPAFQSAVSH